MALELIQPYHQHLYRGPIDVGHMVDHLGSTLRYFAAKQNLVYRMFYIGITGEIDLRLAEHRREKPFFKLMVPVVEEPEPHVTDSFDLLELKAIEKFGNGYAHPADPSRMLQCKNEKRGSKPKRMLYILVG